MLVLLLPVCAYAATNTGGQYSSLNTSPTYWWLPGNLWHHLDQTNNEGTKQQPPAIAKSESASPKPAQVLNTDSRGGIIILVIVLFMFLVVVVVACLPKKYNDH